MIDTETAKNLVTGSIWRWRATPTLEELEEVEVRGMSGRNHGHVSYVYKGCSDLFYMEILCFLERACLVSLPGQREVPAADPKQDQALVTPAGPQLPKVGSQWRYNSSSETSKCHGAIFTVAKVVDDSIEGSSTCGCGGAWSSVDYFLKRHTPVVKPEKQVRPTCNAGCTPQTPCISVECPARAENEISKSAWATRQHPNLIPASWLGSIMSDYIVPGGEPSARPEFATSGAGALACDMGLRR
jgi:hypothetical protein